MFRVIFVLLLTTYGLDSVPSPRLLAYTLPFLEKCRDDMTSLIQCTEEVGQYLSQGVPALDIPQYKPHYNYHEPYHHTYDEIFVGNARLKHIKVHGISNYTIKTMKLGLFRGSSLRITIRAHYEKLVFKSRCSFNGTLFDYFIINVEEHQCKMTLKEIDVYMVLEGHFYFPRGEDKKYFKIDDARVLRILGSLEFGVEHDNDNIFGDYISADLHKTDSLRALRRQIEPDFWVGISKFVRTIASKVFDNYPAQQLFHSKLGAHYLF